MRAEIWSHLALLLLFSLLATTLLLSVVTLAADGQKCTREKSDDGRGGKERHDQGQGKGCSAWKFGIRASDDIDWWKKTIVYQIYPRSFQDSNGDGVGDLQGNDVAIDIGFSVLPPWTLKRCLETFKAMTSCMREGILKRLDYCTYLNVGAIWLSPVYKSPMIDHGYDIQDFVDIDPVFGTLADFDQLVKEAHARDIHVIMDYIPNHSSDLHPWFVESRKGGGAENPYSDFYVWTDGKLVENGTRVPPNNWMSCFSVPAWTWDPLRQQFYLHQFAKEQPDLNYRNPRVVEEMNKVLQFWLDRGVDGFRVDAIGTLFEVEDLSLNSPRSFLPNVLPHQQFYYDHIYTRDRPEIHDVIAGWRHIFNEHDKKHGGHTFMVTEIYSSLTEEMKYYHSGADMPFNFGFIADDLKNCGGVCFKQIITSWLDAMPQDKWPNFVLGNHDKPRVSTRKGQQYVNGLNVLLLTLPGTPTTYFGEEIGMNDIEVSYEDTQDPWGRNLGPELYRDGSRDPCRSPMQWSNELNAQFSTAEKTWLPLNPDYITRNIKSQRADRGSSLNIYRKTAELRQRREFRTSHVTFTVTNDEILSYLRYIPGCSASAVYLVIVNVGEKATTDRYVVKVQEKLYDQGVVVLSTASVDDEGSVISLKSITLDIGQAIVLKLKERPSVREEL